VIRVVAATCAVMLACSQPAWSARLSSFDLPGFAVCGAAIADDGTVAGNEVGRGPAVSFLLQDGVFTILPLLDAQGRTSVTGINRAHILAGSNTVFGRDFSAHASGFLVYGAGSRAVRVDVQIPGAVSSTVTAIANDGAIAGSFQMTANGATLGYVRHGDKMTILNDGSSMVTPSAIDPTGTRLVGTSLNGGIVSWSYQDGKFTPVRVPGALVTFSNGINRAGTVSGTYLTGSPGAPTRHGFVMSSGKYTSVDIPHASATIVTGINAHGTITGCYTDPIGTHGLIYAP
jgi:hypothetical protein